MMRDGVTGDLHEVAQFRVAIEANLVLLARLTEVAAEQHDIRKRGRVGRELGYEIGTLECVLWLGHGISSYLVIHVPGRTTRWRASPIRCRQQRGHGSSGTVAS
jgi:hypothetical protein